VPSFLLSSWLPLPPRGSLENQPQQSAFHVSATAVLPRTRRNRVPFEYHLTVPGVFLRAFRLPSVPQNQRDTLAYADWQS
jgi:hypothetical protein